MSDKKPIKKNDDDDYESFSISLKSEVADKLEKIAVKTNRTRNEIINNLLEQEVDRREAAYKQPPHH